MTPRMMDAKAYSEWAHAGQVRKYTGEPYANHPARVADMVWGVTKDEDATIASYLHDTVEDTFVTLSDIYKRWGPKIEDMVWALTTEKRPDENRAERKKREMERLAQHGNSAIHTIKLADLIDNTEDIVKHDPSFAKRYLQEKADLLSVLQQGHQGLLIRATDQVRRYMGELGL